MGNNSAGFSMEKSIASYLNEKALCQLNGNMHNFVRWLFGDSLNEKTTVYSDVVPKIGRKNAKADIWIRVGETTKNISLKIGSGNSVHQEKLSEFCDFLKSIDVSVEIIENLKLFHYGDDSTDGKGEKRYSSIEIKEKYKNEIKLVNKSLNRPAVLKKILDRVLIKGTTSNPVEVDAFYHGHLESGIWASREEVIDFLLNNISGNMAGVQFSKLTYQPWTRDENRTAVHPERREVMQLKWGSMSACFKLISEGRKDDGNK